MSVIFSAPACESRRNDDVIIQYSLAAGWSDDTSAEAGDDWAFNTQ